MALLGFESAPFVFRGIFVQSFVLLLILGIASAKADDRPALALEAAHLASQMKGRAAAFAGNPQQQMLSTLQERANDMVSKKNETASQESKSLKSAIPDPAAAVKSVQDLFASQTPIQLSPSSTEANITGSGGANASGSGGGGSIADQIAGYQADIQKSGRGITELYRQEAESQIVNLQNQNLTEIYTLKSSIQKQIQQEQSSVSRKALDEKPEQTISAARQGILRTPEQREADTRKHNPYFQEPISKELPVGN